MKNLLKLLTIIAVIATIAIADFPILPTEQFNPDEEVYWLFADGNQAVILRSEIPPTEWTYKQWLENQ